MGHSYFFRTRGTIIAQAWLLASCVLFCLRSGDSLQCHECVSWNPGEPCIPLETTCNAEGDNAVCMTNYLYKEDGLHSKSFGCSGENDDGSSCENKGDFPELKLRFETLCCSEDLCNKEK